MITNDNVIPFGCTLDKDGKVIRLVPKPTHSTEVKHGKRTKRSPRPRRGKTES